MSDTSHADNTPPADGHSAKCCGVQAQFKDNTPPADVCPRCQGSGKCREWDGPCSTGKCHSCGGTGATNHGDNTPPADVRCRPCSMGYPNECEHPERVCRQEQP